MKNTSKITSQNETWGFFGTLVRGCGMTNSGAASVFDLAAKTLARLSGKTVEDAREYLDSMWGRHLGDQFSPASDFSNMETILKGQLVNFFMHLAQRGVITAKELERQKQRCREMIRDAAIAEIANVDLDIETLESGAFAEVSIRAIKAALVAAYEAGRQAKR